MIKNYFKIAWRNIFRNKGYSALNIFGLAIGITCASLILLWVQDEVSFNEGIKDNNLVFNVPTNQKYDGEWRTFFMATPGPLASVLKDEIPEITKAARLRDENFLFSVEDQAINRNGAYTDEDLFEIFGLNFIEGNPTDAFKNKNGIVITQNLATILLGDSEKVLGKTIQVDQKSNYTITGIIEDLPENSTYSFSWLVPFKNFTDGKEWTQDYGSNFTDTFVKLDPTADVEKVDKKVRAVLPAKTGDKETEAILFSAKDWHLRAYFKDGKIAGGRIEYVRLFSFIALIILIIACINFMNLATARSEKRAGEVGMRKALGSGRKQLIFQFTTEAILNAVLAGILSVVAIILLLPEFNSLVDKNLSLNLILPSHILSLLGISLACGILAGLYPAFYLSSFKPIEVLKGTRKKAGSASSEKVIEKLTAINKANDPNKELTSTKAAYYLQPIKKMNLYGYNGDPTNIKTVRIFGLVLILILAIACINYVNLNTARAIQRAKEVSLRKLIGAERKHLFLQFIIESCIFFIIALVLSLALIFILVPSFNSISGKEISFNLLDIDLWKLIATVFVATLLASSIYPAILLSSFKPLEAIKGNIAPGIGAVNFRKVLVCIQFMFSSILIICTIIIGKQLDYLNTMNPGYDRAQVLSFSMTDTMIEHREAVENQIKNLPGIQEVSFSNNNLIDNGWTTGDTNWEGKNQQNNFIVAPLGVDEKFLPMLKMELIEGNNFSGIASDSSHYILNETAVEKIGLKDPIGKSFELWETKGTIIGVVKDFNFESLKQKIEPAVLFYDPEPYMMYIKTANGDVRESIAGLEKVWSSYNEGYPFNFSFLDERYEQMYRDDMRTGKLFRIFSILAIFVSCLGLFGLTTYSAQLKKREIGIRKVLGASILQISKLLSKDFMKLVFISSIAAIPLAWYLMQFWLQNFIYRTTMSWWIFAGSGVSILIIALITVSLQSIRAAMANPVQNIRTE